MSEQFYGTVTGMDVHKKSINVAVIRSGETQVTEQWQVENTPRALKKLAKKVKGISDAPVEAVYEAGPCGYAFMRQMKALGIDCRVIAPSLIPKKPGERIKTDRRDAVKIATMYRAGLLTEIQPPSSTDQKSCRGFFTKIDMMIKLCDQAACKGKEDLSHNIEFA